MAQQADLDQYYRHIDTAIETSGFSVMAVGYGGCSTPGCCGPRAAHPWAYTIGLSMSGHEELVMLGSELDVVQRALNDVGDALVDGVGLVDEVPFRAGGVGVKLVTVPDEWVLSDSSRMAGWFGFHQWRSGSVRLPRLRQVVWADAAGRFPDHPGSVPVIADAQPILRDDPLSYPHRASRDVRRAVKHARRRVA